MIYYGTRLSGNLSLREPEGYLFCLNVPVARTGTQDYLPEELGLPAQPSRTIPVARPESEVFSPACMASFEGMPVTNDHPPDGVSLENIRRFQKGHAHNIRRGTGSQSDLLLADLIITDEALIDAILHQGKREISCGYLYDLCRENGEYIQRNIRGNHVAVVDAGRAGPRVCIHDKAAPGPAGTQSPARRQNERSNPMKKSLARVLARLAKDGDIEEVAEIIQEMVDPGAAETVIAVEAEPVPAAAEAPAAGPDPEPESAAGDDDFSAAVLSRLDRLIELLTPAAADEAPAEPEEEIAEAVEEALEAAAAQESPESAAEEIAQVIAEVLSPEADDPVSSTIGEPAAEDGMPGPAAARTADALRTALRVVRPALAALPRTQRIKTCAEIAARLRRGGDSCPAAGTAGADTAGVYAALARAGSGRRPDASDLGARIMASRNPNYKA